MAYQLKENESLPEGLRRVGQEEQQETLEALTSDNPHKGVHEARKHLKKLRALIRLVRDELGHEQYKKRNNFFRDIGRHLAQYRDITSQIEILEKLHQEHGDLVKGEKGFQAFLDLLYQEREKIFQKGSQNGQWVDQDIAKIKAYQKTIVPEHSAEEKTLDSLKRVYKRGYKGYHRALKKAETKGMHEWRKRVKYLWHQFQLIQVGWPAMIQAYMDVLKDLSDVLGDYHDLAIIEDKAKQVAPKLSTAFIKKFYKVTEKRKDHLHGESLKLGRLIYAEKPKAFKKRMRGIIESLP